MTCGEGVPLCGVLCLQSGLGQGVYDSKAAAVHGLWPETGNYGTSQCIAPQNKADATKVYSCYAADTAGPSGVLGFENHEWEKHGACAGVQDVDDFFGQICDISAAPVAALEAARVAGGNFDSLATTMKASYPVFSLDEENAQILLSVCAGSDGKWKISAAADFVTNCGGSSPGPSPGPSPSPTPASPTPAPAPTPNVGSCSAGQPGPKCSADADCASATGCVRCAKSGKCTDIPKFESTVVV